MQKTLGISGSWPRRARRAALGLAAALLVASCVESAPAGPLVALIPGDALAAALIESPYKLYAGIEELWKAAGLEKTFGGSPSDLARKSLPNPEEALAELDFARPWAFALLRAAPGSSETRNVLYIPLRGKSEAFLSSLAGDKMRVVATAKGYAVLASGEGDIAFPPAQPLDLSKLGRYPASSIKFWGDPAAIRLGSKDGFKPIADAARRFVSGEKGGMADAASAFRDAALALLKEIKAADGALVPSAAGLSLRVGAVARPSGVLAKALGRAGNAPSALDWAAQADSGALYGYAWSLDPALGAELYGSAAKPLLLALGIPEGAAGGLERLQARWAAATGPRGAASFDMDMDLSAVAGLEGQDPAAMAAAMKKMFSYRVEMLQEAKDEAKYRELVRGMAKDPDLVAFWKAYEGLFGMGVSLSNVDKQEGSFSYGEIRLAMEASDPAKLGLGAEGAAAKAMFDAMADMMSYRWAVSGGRLAMGTGSAAELKALAARQASPRPLASDPAFVAFAKTLPPKPMMVGALSMRRLFEIYGKTAGAGSPPGLAGMKFDPELFGSWYSYAAAGGAPGAPYLELGMHIPAKDIGGLVGFGAALGGKAPGGDL